MMTDKVILDPCCGSRMFWFDKSNPHAVFGDCRIENGTAIWESDHHVRKIDVNPDVMLDVTDLPFADESFYHVVLDPPHFKRLGDNSWMVKKYGKLPENWEDFINKAFNECMRVLKPYGTLCFKWSEVDIKVSEIVSVVGREPLYGHKSGKRMGTHWLMFIKIPKEGENG